MWFGKHGLKMFYHCVHLEYHADTDSDAGGSAIALMDFPKIFLYKQEGQNDPILLA